MSIENEEKEQSGLVASFENQSTAAKIAEGAAAALAVAALGYLTHGKSLSLGFNLGSKYEKAGVSAAEFASGASKAALNPHSEINLLSSSRVLEKEVAQLRFGLPAERPLNFSTDNPLNFAPPQRISLNGAEAISKPTLQNVEKLDKVAATPPREIDAATESLSAKPSGFIKLGALSLAGVGALALAGCKDERDCDKNDRTDCQQSHATGGYAGGARSGGYVPSTSSTMRPAETEASRTWVPAEPGPTSEPLGGARGSAGEPVGAARGGGVTAGEGFGGAHVGGSFGGVAGEGG